MILDWKEYEATAVKAVEEGIVLLENRNGALPLKENTPVAIYGRIQLHYYKSGTGSGGMVNVSKVTDITRGLLESGKVKVNQELLEVYKKWEEENPFDSGNIPPYRKNSQWFRELGEQDAAYRYDGRSYYCNDSVKPWFCPARSTEQAGIKNRTRVSAENPVLFSI